MTAGFAHPDRKADLATLAQGDDIPRLSRAISLSAMVAYGGATWDWHRLHYDVEFARKQGLPGPVVDGQMLGALLAEAVLDWLGPTARVRKLAFRFRNFVYAGDVVSCTGKVRSVTEVLDGLFVAVDQEITSGERLVVAPASCEVLLPT